MATQTDLYSTVFFQDGEQLTFQDMHSMQRQVRAQVTDQLMQSMIGAVSNSATRPDFGGDDGADVSSLWAYCVSPGHAFLRQGSANNKIQIAPGTLLQKIGNATGLDSTLVPFTFDGTSAGEFTLTNGDATNPRVDLLQMALAYINDTPVNVDFQDAVTRVNTTVANTVTRRRIQCTLSVKAGTPAASPTIPDPDAGFVPVGTAVVGHGWTSGGNAPIFGVDTAEANNVVIHDQRMPLGVRALTVEPFVFMNDTGWTLQNANSQIITSNATNRLYIRCPTRVGRMLAIDTTTISSLSTIASIGRCFSGISSGPSTLFVASNGYGTNAAWDGFIQRARRLDFEQLHTPAAGPTILPSATNKYGVPLWASGYRSPRVDDTSGANPPQNAYLRIQNGISAGVLVGDVTFYVAGT